LSVHQLADGRWIVKYGKGTNPDDPNRTREYFGRGPDAQVAAARRNVELGLGIEARTGTTFAELAERYIKARIGSIAKSTLDDLLYKLYGTINPAIGELPASQIKPSRLDQYVVDRKAKGLKTTSIHRELSIIRAIIRFGVERRLLADNPMQGYTFPRRDDDIIHPPSHAELEAIYNAAPPHLQRAIMLGYYTAMRPGGSELLALRWDRVDLINGTIYVESAKKGGMRARVVPIADGLRELLQAWMAADRKQGPLGLVVHYKGAAIKSMKTSWKATMARAGITRRIRPYDLRHMAATAMLEAKADLKSVSEILGHASPDQTLKTYQHVNNPMRIDAITRLGNPLPAVTKKK
jgi:integrase